MLQSVGYLAQRWEVEGEKMKACRLEFEWKRV